MEKSETIVELAKALSAFQGELKPAKKDSSNPFFHSTYADLASVWQACREPLTKHGLSVTQTLDAGIDKELVVETTLLHSSGEWLSSKLHMRVPIKTTTKKDNQGKVVSETEILNDPQSIGSVISYARRYAISAILGIATDDDDAEEAMSRKLPIDKQEFVKPAKEHWCFQHQAVFFKKGGMRNYAHPILDEHGKPLVDTEGKAVWCNETKEQAQDAEPAPESKPNSITEKASVVVPEEAVESVKQPEAMSPIDMEGLKGSLKQAKWTEGTCISWLKSKVNYQGLDISGKFVDIIKRMNKEQADFLVKEIESRIEMA